MFLDSKKTQYNDIGWPYIGPAIKDNEMKVRVVGESIVVGETLDAYEWVLRLIVEMEPRFSLSCIRFIFADQFVTHSLLTNLAIENTCTLRCDYHHMLNKVWPKAFGKTVYDTHREDFKTLLCGTEREWEHAHQIISASLSTNAERKTKLDLIYKDPDYYAGWWLRNQEGNLELRGSVPAEQNHASIRAHLGRGAIGRGAMWSVPEHARRLMDRQSGLTTKRRKEEGNHFHRVRCYESSPRGQRKLDNEMATKNLAGWCVKHLYKFEASRSPKWEASTNLQRSITVTKKVESYTIPHCGRCPCARRVTYLHQYVHKLVAHGSLDLDVYDHMHYATIRP
jgi:hypothetical protein